MLLYARRAHSAVAVATAMKKSMSATPPMEQADLVDAHRDVTCLSYVNLLVLLANNDSIVKNNVTAMRKVNISTSQLGHALREAAFTVDGKASQHRIRCPHIFVFNHPIKGL